MLKIPTPTPRKGMAEGSFDIGGEAVSKDRKSAPHSEIHIYVRIDIEKITKASTVISSNDQFPTNRSRRNASGLTQRHVTQTPDSGISHDEETRICDRLTAASVKLTVQQILLLNHFVLWKLLRVFLNVYGSAPLRRSLKLRQLWMFNASVNVAESKLRQRSSDES